MFLKNKSVFYKYLLSNIIICIISVSIMGSILNKQVLDILVNEANLNSISGISQLNNLLEDDIQAFLRIVASVSENKVFLPSYTSARFNYRDIEVVNALRSVTLSNNIISDALLYYPATQNFFTNSGALSIDSYNDYLLSYYDNLACGINSDIFDSLDKPDIYRMKDSYGKVKFFYLMYPIPHNSSYPYAVISFKIDYDKLQQLVSANMLQEYKGNAYIYDNNNMLLVSVENMDFTDKELSQLIDINDVNRINKEEKIYKVVLDSFQYSISYIQSGKLGWSYFVIIMNKQFMSRILKTQTFLLLVIIVVLFLMMVIAYFLTFLNYKPIRDLIKHVNYIIPGAPKKSNEIELIRTTVRLINQSNLTLSKRLDDQQRALLSHVLQLMFEGKTVDEKRYVQALASADINLDNAYFATMVVQFNLEDIDTSISENTMEQLTNFKFDYISCFGFELPYNSIIAILTVADDYEVLSANQKNIALSLLSLFKQKNNAEPCIGIGGIYTGSDKLTMSLIESRIALEISPHEGLNINQFESGAIKADNMNFSYPKKELIKIKFCLKQGNLDLALTVIEDILNFVAKTSFLMSNFICYDIINSIIKITEELNLQIEIRDINLLQNFPNINEFKVNLIKIIQNICKQIEIQNNSKNQKLCDEIFECIHNSVTDSNLSLEMLSNKFELSQSYLSAYIKEHKGITFTNYIRNLRIDKAKTQLITTNLHIQDIIANVGYLDASNFIRTFKKMEGLTPGDFRRLYGKKN